MNAVIIVAGGTGSRMQSEMPKQFALLNGKQVIVHCIEKFLTCYPGIQVIVVMHPNYREHFIAIQKYFKMQEITLADGGETRFHSVQNGLAKVDPACRIVAVHDAARPLVSLQTIQNAFAAAEKFKAAIPVITVNESLREIMGDKSKALDRRNYRMVQTPQCFQKEIIFEAYKQAYISSFTDDATVVESAGTEIYLTEGNVENIKITYPQDLVSAASLLK